MDQIWLWVGFNVFVLLLLTHPEGTGGRSAVSVVQEEDDLAVGGSTILIRAAED